jgi:hypothetical protein
LLRRCWSDSSESGQLDTKPEGNTVTESMKAIELPEIFLSKDDLVDLFFRDPFPSSVISCAKDPAPSSASTAEKRRKRKSAGLSEQDNTDDFNSGLQQHVNDIVVDMVETKSGRGYSKKRNVEEVYPATDSTDLVTPSSAIPNGPTRKKKGGATGKKGEKTILPSYEGSGDKLQLDELTSFPMFSNDNQDLTHFLSNLSSYPSLLTFIEDSLSFWIQLNWCFLVRLNEAFVWKRRMEISASMSIERGPTPLRQEDGEPGDKEVSEQWEGDADMIALLGVAKKRYIECAERKKAENLLRSSVEWIEKARRWLGVSSFFHQSSSFSSISVEIHDILSISDSRQMEEDETLKKLSSSEPLPSIDEMKEFIKIGENKQLFRMVDNSAEVSALKQEVKKAKHWKQAFDQLTTIKDDSTIKKEGEGITTKMDEINALIAESRELKVNVEEYLDVIHQQTKTYCLCRQIYFGHMIGCDLCTDWYHLACVGLSTAQAEKAEKYICIRCSLKKSISSTANYIGKIANKWMDYQDHFRATDANIQKVGVPLYFFLFLNLFCVLSFRKS